MTCLGNALIGKGNEVLVKDSIVLGAMYLVGMYLVLCALAIVLCPHPRGQGGEQWVMCE